MTTGTSTKSEVFSKHARLMLQAANLVNTRIEYMRVPEEDKECIDDGEKVVRLFAQRSLRYYADTLSFLADVVNAHRFEWCRFLLPNARTLIDIYARFLHLLINCDSAERRALTCISYQLLSYQVLGDSMYQKTLGIYSDYLKSIKRTFPIDFASFSKKWVMKNKLHFYDTASLVTEENIAAHSVLVSEVFGTKRTYEIYAHFSRLLHGDPYCAGGNISREEYWLVSTSIIYSAFMIELIDRHFLELINRRDFSDWLKSVKAAKQELAAIWTRL